MVTIVSDDINMGAAGEITFKAGRLPTIAGLFVMGFSVDQAQAYGEHPETKGNEIAYWSLTAEQLGLLLALAPERRLMSEPSDPDECGPDARVICAYSAGGSFGELGARLAQAPGGVAPDEATAVLYAVQRELEPTVGAPQAAERAVRAVLQIVAARTGSAGG
jgi:hypothetical protein